MIFSVTKETRSLSEIFVTDTTVVRSDTGMRKHVLVEIRYEYILVNWTSHIRLVFFTFMILQLLRRIHDHVALAALIALLVQQQMIVETSPILELLHT